MCEMACAGLELEHLAQIAEGLCGCDGVVVEFEAEALLQRGLQLHAAEAVEVQVFGEALVVVVAGDVFAGDFGDDLD